MTTTNSNLLKLCALVITLGGCGNSGVERIVLPKSLKEISGLAVEGNTLLAVADEKSRIYRINFEEGLVKYLGALGDPPLKGDFEGIATDGPDIYLITSDGILYRRSVSAEDGAFDKYETGIGDLCEIEGLEIKAGLAYILCKTARDESVEKQLTVFAWDIAQAAVVEGRGLRVPWSQLPDGDKLHPSALAFVDGEWLVLAARQKRWLVLDEQGNFLRGGKLPNRGTHPQAEGVAVLGDATYIADEGKKRGSLTRYPGRF